MSNTTILYKDIAPGAEEDASVSVSETLNISSPSLLPFGVSPPPIATLEQNYWLLDGTYQLIDDQKLSFWSAYLSKEDCIFSNPPVITVTFDQQYSSTGITLEFDTATGEYCSHVNIKWYQGDTLKADVDFAPNASRYYCKKSVTSYNKVVVTLNKTSIPRRRAKVNRIMFGVLRYFDMTEIRKASVTNEMDLLSSELPVSVLNWTLDSKENVEFMFQLKQPVEVRNGDSLIGVYYIDGSKRIGSGLYDIECYDAFGVLDEIPFGGGVYSGKSAKELLEEILGGDFELECEAEDTALTGVILPGTKRDAIQQVLFAWGICASTDGRKSIRVFVPGDKPSEIGTDRTFFGASVETAAIVTKVIVTAHSYAQSSSGSVEIGGVKYEDTKTIYTVDSPDVTASDKQSVIEVSDATLVSPSIGQSVAQRVYDYYTRRNTHAAKIVWKGDELGECATLPNAWGSTNTGNIVRMEIKLSNTVVANCRTVGI